MNKDYIEKLKTMFGDLTNLTSDKLQSFIADTMKQLFSLREKLESTDPQEREEGMQEAAELKQILEGQMAVLSNTLGEDPSKLAAMAEDMEMSGDEAEILQNAKDQFQYLRESFSQQKTPRVKKHKTQTINLVG